MRYLAVFLLFFIATPAFAFTFDYSPSGNAITSPVTFNVSFDLIDSGITTDTYWCLEMDDNVPLSSNEFYSSNTYPVNAGLNSGTFVLDIPVGVKIRMVYLVSMAGDLPCNGSNWNEATLAFYEVLLPPSDPLFESTFLFQVIDNTSVNLTWGSNNGFWGNSTPAQVSASVIEGTQNTGANLWPLLIFLGVSLAFIIFVQVVALTRHTTRIKETTKRKNAVFNDNKADELKEYYSRDGNAPNWLVEKIRGKKDT